MEEEIREVVISNIAQNSLEKIFEYGAETFYLGYASKFVCKLRDSIAGLSTRYLHYPICKSMPIKDGTYRNIILHQHLVVYRITETRIEVLDVIHSRRHPSKISAVQKIKL